VLRKQAISNPRPPANTVTESIMEDTTWAPKNATRILAKGDAERLGNAKKVEKIS